MFSRITLFALLSNFLTFLNCFEPNDQINLPLKKIFPSILNVTEQGILECYDETLNGIKVSLFDQNVTGNDIVTKYYSSLPGRVFTNDSISNLFNSLNNIINYVCTCSINLQKSNDTPQVSYTKVGLTSLSDMSNETFKKLTNSNENLNQMHTLARQVHYNPGKISPSGKGLGGCKLLNRTSPAPKSWDWRKHGIVTSVRQQLTCGACWAVITAQAVESALLKSGKIRSWGEHLSVQQILDYDNKSYGCEGGSAPASFAYVHFAGLTSESAYPYQNRKNFPLARRKKFPILANISDYCVRGKIHMPPQARDNLTDGDIERELVAHGPLYVLIHGEGYRLQNYKSGIIDDESCPKKTNHAALLVGYDERAFILQNTWGPNWGEKGYFKVAKGKNVCGYLTEIAYALP